MAIKNKIDIEKLFVETRALAIDIQRTKNLIFDGKIILSDRILQGAMTKSNNLLEYIHGYRDNDKLAEKISKG